MTLVRLGAEGVRNLHPFEIFPSPTLNLVSGTNGAGKTSLLEAIYLLSRGKSFRTSRVEKARHPDAETLRVYGAVLANGSSLPLGMERRGREVSLRVGGEPVSRQSQLTRLLPVTVIGTDSHRIVEDGPELRRRFMDWSVFHMEHPALQQWPAYDLALRQRNAALRAQLSTSEIALWSHTLATAAQAIHQARLATILDTGTYFHDLVTTLLDEVPVRLEYRPGWDVDGAPLSEQLLERLPLDRSRGFTSLGPHRAELVFRMEHRDVREYLSRGQQKLLLTALLTSQAARIHDRTGRIPILLYDDLPAELDDRHQARLWEYLGTFPGQCFITAIDADRLPPPITSDARFHVEQGRITQVL